MVLCAWKARSRGYDTGALFREDCLLHIQHLQMELEADMKRIKQAEKEYAAAKEYFWLSSLASFR